MKKIIARCILTAILAVALFVASDCTSPKTLTPTQTTIIPYTSNPTSTPPTNNPTYTPTQTIVPTTDAPVPTANPNDNHTAEALDVSISASDYAYALKYLQYNCVLDQKTIDDLKTAPLHSTWISPESKSVEGMQAGYTLEQYIVVHNGYDATITYKINVIGDLTNYISIEGVNPADISPLETRAFLVRLILPKNAVSGRYAFKTNLENLTDTSIMKVSYGTTFYINVK